MCLNMLLFAGFIASAPSVEKIKVFEKYFTSKIHLYDKVSLSACVSFCVVNSGCYHPLSI